jgi:hypothetical protein
MLKRWTLGCCCTSVTAIVLTASPAAAYDLGRGGVQCEDTACTVSATVPGAQQPGSGTSNGGSSAQPVLGGGGGTGGGDGGPAPNCVYDIPIKMVDGRTFLWPSCGGVPVTGAGAVAPAVPVATGAPAAPGAPAPPPLPAPAVLGAQAASKLKLPAPVVHTSPEAPVMQIVGIPTWAWLAPESVATQTATAAAANGVASMSVTATAQLNRVTWDFGDGAVVVCTGPGTPYDSSNEADGRPRSSPDCGHTYLRSSARQPGEAYPVSVSAEWAVTWAGGGQTGAAPAQAQTITTALRVGELQAVNY